MGFEPTNSCLLNDFESFAFDHSATSPLLVKFARIIYFNYELFINLNFYSQPASFINLIARELFTPRSSTVTLSGINSPKSLTMGFWFTSFKGCSKVGAARPLLPFGDAKYSRSLIASFLLVVFLIKMKQSLQKLKKPHQALELLQKILIQQAKQKIMRLLGHQHFQF